MIKSIDRNTCQMLRDELNSALKAISAKHGININAGAASFTSNSVTFKVECATISETGQVLTKDATAFQQLATSYGLKSEFLFKEFVMRGERLQIVGCAPKSYKFPILVKKADGRVYKYPSDVLVAHFNQMGI